MSEVKTLVTLVLGGMFDHNELGDIDIVYEAPACEALQRDLVDSIDDVHVELVSRIDYDAAQSQLAALREELAKKHELLMSMADRANQFEGERDQWRAMVGHICATIPTADVLASTETGQKTVDYFKALQQRLADAERRNAVMRDALEVAEEQLLVAERHLDLGQDDSICFEPAILTVRAALNPKPEAASHDL